METAAVLLIHSSSSQKTEIRSIGRSLLVVQVIHIRIVGQSCVKSLLKKSSDSFFSKSKLVKKQRFYTVFKSTLFSREKFAEIILSKIITPGSIKLEDGG